MYIFTIFLQERSNKRSKINSHGNSASLWIYLMPSRILSLVGVIIIMAAAIFIALMQSYSYEACLRYGVSQQKPLEEIKKICNS
jgi:hypothetical protein